MVEAEFDQKELFGLYGLRRPLLTIMRSHAVSQIIDCTEALFASGAMKQIFASSGATGLMVNGSAAIPKTLRASGDLDISVIHDATKEYSLSGASSGMDQYMARTAELLPGNVRVVKMQERAGDKWQELAKKYGYKRYYVTQTLTPNDMAALQTQGVITSEQIEEARNATRAICSKAVKEDGSITFVTLVDAGVNSPQHFLLPVDKHGTTIHSPSGAFDTQLSYLSATEEGVRKFCAVLDPTRNIHPMVFAKDVFDTVARHSIVGEWNKKRYSPDDISLAHFDTDSLLIDILLLSLPIQRWFDKEHRIPNFKRIDPEIRDNITRLTKGLKQLKENDYIPDRLTFVKEGQAPEIVDSDSEEAAKYFLGLTWKMCELYFGVKRDGTGHKPTYTINVSPKIHTFWDKAVKFDTYAPKPVTVRRYGEVPSAAPFDKFMNDRIRELAALAEPTLTSQYQGKSADNLSMTIATTIALARNQTIRRSDIRD